MDGAGEGLNGVEQGPAVRALDVVGEGTREDGEPEGGEDEVVNG